MGIKQTIELIIKAQDEASKQVKKVEDTVKKFSNSSKTSFTQSAQSTQKLHQELEKTGKQLEKVSDDYLKVGTEGKKGFNSLTKEQQRAVVQFHKISKEAQVTVIAARECGEAIGTIGKGWAINQFKQAAVDTKTWAGSLDYAKNKMDLLGANTDSFKGKLQMAGSAIQTYMGSKWDSVTSKIDSVKSKMSSFASGIKTGLSNALSSVTSRVESLGQAFDGIGGMISSSIGMTGVGSIKELTIGLSLSREKMSSLNTAIMGSADASNKLLGSIDTMTNSSVVGMDQMVNALNKIKLSTQMSNAELDGTKEVVMKLGEASMLMGNDTETAAYQMGEAFSGLNGDFQILKENFGITKEKMKDMDWSGQADDVEGYTEALSKCLDGLGDLGGVMDTNSGKIARVQKKFRTAGRTLGDMLTPYIGQAADAFLQLEDRFPGISQGLIGIAGGVSIFASVAPTITPMIDTFREVGGAVQDAAKFLGLMEAAEGAVTLQSTMLSIAELAGAEAAVVQTAANGGLTASFWAMASAILANPLTWVVVALAAVAVAVYEVGKAFGWWKDVGSMLDAVWAGIQRLWSAFINNPDVQGFIHAIGDAWKAVTSAIGPVISSIAEFFGISAGGEFDIVRAIIDSVGAAFHRVADSIRFAIGVFQTIYGVFQGIYSFLAPYGEAIYNFLKPIVCILLGCSPGIVPALEKVYEVFNTVWSAIAGFIGSYVSTVVSVITTVVTTIQSIVNVFAQLLSGQISLGEAIPMIWNLIYSAFVTIGGTILSFISRWAGQLLSLAIRAATNFMNGIANRIRALPGKVWGYIISTANNIRNGVVQWVNNAKNGATNTVNAVVNRVTGLPGTIYNEFMNIGKRIGDAFNHVVKQAADFANGIKNKILNILGIHSPGILQKKIGIEFENISAKSIGEKARMAYNQAKNYAQNIMSGFESQDMSSLTVDVPSVSAATADMGVDTTGLSVNAPSVTGANVDTSGMTTDVTSSYDELNTMVSVDLAELTSMNKTSFDQISTDEQSTMNNIYNHVNNSMMSILKTNKTALNQNTSTTKSQLGKMNSSTKSVTKQMVGAWNTMKNSIVRAANNIKTESTNHFNKLSNTIGGFYRKLQNPSQWGTGSGTGPGRAAHGTGAYRPSSSVNSRNAMRVMSSRLAGSAVRENNLPRTINVKTVQDSRLKGLKDFISDGSSIDVQTLFETGVLNPALGLKDGAYGAWDNTVKPNVKKIKNTANKWSMVGPKLANRAASKITFHVQDFLSGTPKIGLDDFITMAYALVKSTSYGYYADSSRYGNWVNALNHGVLNCSDGSDALIALARTCGLPAEKVHCYWGTSSNGIAGTSKGEGHFVARIGGRIMDSVSMRHGSLTSPKVHGYGTGPAPRATSPSDNTNVSDYSEMKITMDDITIIHKFKDLPAGVDEATIVRMIQEGGKDETFVKNLVKNIRFQLLDQKEKIRLERKQKRSKGIGA
ncbi:MAG: hypothetical protein IJH65_10090 [Methanobrevibacter sp.]|nr:hypothetical protein [Methanobrevibacter sp.]